MEPSYIEAMASLMDEYLGDELTWEDLRHGLKAFLTEEELESENTAAEQS